MIAHNEDDLTCDLAETYGIYDWRVLPVRKLAVLACGLPASSRIMMGKADAKLTVPETLLALAVDRLGQLVWLSSKDGAAGKNRPPSVLAELTKTPQKSEFQGYDTPEDFEAARQELLRG